MSPLTGKSLVPSRCLTLARGQVVGRLLRGVLFAGVIAGCVPSLLVAQEGAQEGGTPSAPQAEQTEAPPRPTPPVLAPQSPLGTDGTNVSYVGPDVFILLDEQGRPQPMPGMTYEDFMEAWKQSQQLDHEDREPRYTLESLEIRGEAHDRFVRLLLELDVRLLASDRVTIPLGLRGAIAEAAPEVEELGQARSDQPRSRGGESEVEDGAGPPRDATTKGAGAYVDFDSNQQGYFAHLSGKKGTQQRITMRLLLPVEQNGVLSSIETNWPRAVTSKLELAVPENISEASVSEGAILMRSGAAGGTRLTATGLGGQFRMDWATAQTDTAEPATVLSATGAISTSIDGRGVQTEARIAVQSFGGGFDRFRIRLPAGAKLIQQRASSVSNASTTRVRITVEPGASPGDPLNPGVQERQIVLVELPEKQQGPVEVTLVTEQPLGLVNEESAVELAGFEVLGAVRQFGDIALRVADDWQLRWKAGRHVRQVDSVDLATALQATEVTAAFQYDRQPWALPVHVSPRQSRVHVTPEYELTCLADEVRMRVRLAYQVLGSRTFEFRVDLKGWLLTADPIESNGLVNLDQMQITREGVLELPLSQAASRRAEVVFQVRRPAPRQTSRVELEMPIPQADSVATGLLTVQSSPGIELIPDAQMAGLAAQPVATASDGESTLLTDAGQFRYRCFSPAARFSAERVTRAREVETEIATQIEMSPVETKVVQLIGYRVRYEPIKELVFEVPDSLLGSDQLIDISVSSPPVGEASGTLPISIPLTMMPLAEEYRSADIRGPRRLRTALPKFVMGDFMVRIEYSAPHDLDDDRDGVVVPLIRPADGQQKSHRAVVRSPRGLVAGLDGSATDASWRSLPGRIPAGRGAIEFAATHGELSLPLTLQESSGGAGNATTIRKVWLQTWLAGTVRQDRSAFQFQSTAPSVIVELPPGVSPEEIEVLLDGESAIVDANQTGRLVVAIASGVNGVIGASAPPLRTLEIRSRQQLLLPVVARHRLSPPQLVGNDALAEVYWQIVSPEDRHLVAGPDHLAPASELQWLRSFFGRSPVKSQTELEAWVGASNQLAPAPTQNAYLYSGLAPVASIEVVMAPRWLLVLGASTLWLGLALLWIYLPLVRRGWVLLLLAGIVIALAFTYPVPALLIAQVSVLGVILVIVALSIQRLVGRPARVAHLTKTIGSTIRQTTPPRSDSQSLLSLGPASTAPTASMHVPEAR